jgi:hypothetical protein
MSRPYEEHFFPPGDYTTRLNELWQAIELADNEDISPRTHGGRPRRRSACGVPLPA